jgi:multisubunit Na+/H+ antiporter MnhE subunit
LRHPGIVPIPIAERTPLGVTITSLVTTLSPGTFLVDVDEADRSMLMHVIDASNPDAVREEYEVFYRRYQRHVFP